VRSPLERVDEHQIASAVAAGWGLRINALRYFPEGGGAYHWIAQAGDRRWFVTCDDLDTKPWLGSDRGSVCGGLLVAYGTAMELRAAGLPFVVAPMATAAGAPAERVDERHSVSVFDFTEGEPGRWGQPVEPSGRRELVTMLARLHRATPPGPGPSRRRLELPGRQGFEEALDDLGRPWDGGPLSEPVRHELAENLDLIVGWLADLDRYAARFGDGTTHAVVTHGEPHPGNLIRTGTGLALVDWDTVAVARPERDLWMLVDGDGSLLSTYRDLTGVTLDREALAAYRLLWALSDAVSFTTRLRAEHRQNTDANRSLAALRLILQGQEPTPYGPAPMGVS
jgi:spectinomycin phosphotransferase